MENKQTEMKGMPKRKGLDAAAAKYLKFQDEVLAKKNEVDDFAPTLIKCFQKENRKKVNIEGRIVALNHVEQDMIKVTKTKKI